MRGAAPSAITAPCRGAFCEYDKDGDGSITVDELREVLKGESSERVQGYIREYDTNGDGQISYEVCRAAPRGGFCWASNWLP